MNLIITDAKCQNEVQGKQWKKMLFQKERNQKLCETGRINKSSTE